MLHRHIRRGHAWWRVDLLGGVDAHPARHQQAGAIGRNPLIGHQPGSSSAPNRWFDQVLKDSYCSHLRRRWWSKRPSMPLVIASAAGMPVPKLLLPAKAHAASSGAASGSSGPHCSAGPAPCALAEGMAAGDQRHGFFVIHRHAGEGFANVTCAEATRVRLAIRAFGIDVNQAHLHGGQRVFQVAGRAAPGSSVLFLDHAWRARPPGPPGRAAGP